MKIYNSINMGNTENGSRTENQGGRVKALLTSIGAAGLLASCGNAEAADSSRMKSPEPVKVAAVERVVEVTRGQCLALGVKSEKIACLRQLSAQNKAEIAAIDKSIETEKEANDQRRTTVEVLSKKIEDRALSQDPTQ